MALHDKNVAAIEAIESELTRRDVLMRDSFRDLKSAEGLLLEKAKSAKAYALGAREASRRLLKEVWKEISRRLYGGPKGGSGTPSTSSPPPSTKGVVDDLLKSSKRFLSRVGNTARRVAAPIGWGVTAGSIAAEVYEAPEGEKMRTAVGAAAEEAGSTGGFVLVGAAIGISSALAPVVLAAEMHFDISGRVARLGRRAGEGIYDTGNSIYEYLSD